MPGPRLPNRCFATIKRELTMLAPGPREQEFDAPSSGTSRAGHGTRRPHPTLGYLSPAQYEAVDTMPTVRLPLTDSFLGRLCGGQTPFCEVATAAVSRQWATGERLGRTLASESQLPTTWNSRTHSGLRWETHLDFESTLSSCARGDHCAMSLSDGLDDR
jgi:hypothetical protein